MSTFGAKLKGLRAKVMKIKRTVAAAAATAAVGRDVPHPVEDKFRSSCNAVRNAIRFSQLLSSKYCFSDEQNLDDDKNMNCIASYR